jgi:hypothetical protein
MKEKRMKIGFALKIQDQVKQVRMKLIDNLIVQLKGNIPSVTAEIPEAGRAFGASQVAGGCRLNGNSERISLVPHFTCKAAQVITGKKFYQVDQSPGCHPLQEAKAVTDLSRQWDNDLFLSSALDPLSDN